MKEASKIIAFRFALRFLRNFLFIGSISILPFYYNRLCLFVLMGLLCAGIEKMGKRPGKAARKMKSCKKRRLDAKCHSEAGFYAMRGPIE